MTELEKFLDDYTNESGYVHIPKTLLIDAVGRLLGDDRKGERK